MSFISLTDDRVPNQTISALYEKICHQEDSGGEVKYISKLSLGTQQNEGFKRKRRVSDCIDFLDCNVAENRSTENVQPPTFLKIPQLSAPIHDKCGYKVLFSTSKSNKRTFNSVKVCMQTSPKDLVLEQIPIHTAIQTSTKSSSVKFLGSRTSQLIEKEAVSIGNPHVFQNTPSIPHVFEPERKTSGADIGRNAHIIGKSTGFTHYFEREENGGHSRGDFKTESTNEGRVAMPPHPYVRCASQISATINSW